MAENIKISVIIPVYNAVNYISRVVRSILIQDFDGLEVILVDDGSTDGSAVVCDKFSEQDSRVRVIHKKNGGVSSARNEGLDAAQGEFVMFVDADDVIHQGALEKMYSKNSDFVLAGFEKVVDSRISEKYCPVQSVHYSGTEDICLFFDKVLPEKNTYILNSSCFKLFRRSVLIENGVRFIEGLSFAEDKIFVMSFLQHVRNIRTVEMIVYSYMIRSGSLSADMKSESHAREIFRLLESYIPVLKGLQDRFSASHRVSALYHTDFIGRYVCRILGIFATTKTELLTCDNIQLLYKYMSADQDLGVLSIRPGQIPNILLYKLGKPQFTCFCYKAVSTVSTIFHK